MNRLQKLLRFFVELFLFWLLPASLILSYHQWIAHDWATPIFALYALGVPALGMYLNVGVGAGYLKMWRFNVRYQINGVAIQIGLIYTAVVNLLILAWVSLMGVNFLTSWFFALLIGASTSLAGVLFDLMAVHFGFLEVYVPAYFQKLGTRKIVFSYGFWFFGFIGLLVALNLQFGFWSLGLSPLVVPVWIVFILGITVIAVPCSGYLLLKRITKSYSL